MTAPLFQPALRMPAETAPYCDLRADSACAEKFRLRAAYIHALAEFNRVAAPHAAAVRAGLRGAAAAESWRKFRESCKSAHAAWGRYRTHVTAHACKRGAGALN